MGFFDCFLPLSYHIKQNKAGCLPHLFITSQETWNDLLKDRNSSLPSETDLILPRYTAAGCVQEWNDNNRKSLLRKRLQKHSLPCFPSWTRHLCSCFDTNKWLSQRDCIVLGSLSQLDQSEEQKGRNTLKRPIDVFISVLIAWMCSWLGLGMYFCT